MSEPGTPAPPNQASVLEIYKMLVEMADRVSQRRQAANNFYLSVNTAIIGASAYLSAFHPSWVSVVIMALAGFCVSLFWIRNIQSYKELNEGKFHVITQIEQMLPIMPYTDEWEFLTHAGRGKKYKPFHTVEVLVPWVFVAVHVLQLVTAIPWLATLRSLACIFGV